MGVRRADDIDRVRTERRRDLGGQRLAQRFGPLRVHQHLRRLHVDRAVQAGGQQEMALQQGAAVAVMLQYVVSVHRCRFSFPSASQPLARSTELMLAVARRAAMILVRCFTSRTSISTNIPKKSVVRLVIFRLVMLPLCLAMIVVSALSAPGSLLMTRLMRPTWPCDFSASAGESQARSSQRSGCSANCSSASQSMVWMVTPLPVVTMPTLRSPGSGWQQPAKCIAMPGIRPRIGMPLPALPDDDLCRRGRGGALAR